MVASVTVCQMALTLVRSTLGTVEQSLDTRFESGSVAHTEALLTLQASVGRALGREGNVSRSDVGAVLGGNSGYIECRSSSTTVRLRY